MKLPWDEKYLKISFHVIFTLTVVYILGVLVSGAAYVFLNAGAVLRVIGGVARRVLSVFSPLVVAIVTAYLLEPVVAFFQNKYETLRFGGKQPSVRMAREKRTAGVILTLVSIVLALTIFVLSVAMKLKAWDAQTMSQGIALTFAKTVNDLTDFYTGVEVRLKEMGILDYVSDYLAGFIAAVVGLVQNIGDTAVRTLASAGGGIVSFLMGLIISVYFMRDKAAILKKLREIMDAFLPQRMNFRLGNILGDINAVLSGYIRGQLTDAVIMAVLIGGWLAILKVNFAVMIGIFSGLANLIPYFGSITAFVLAVAVAFFSGEPATALYAGIGIIVLQQIDGMVIIPKVVGGSVELSPVLVLLSLAVGGEMFGLLGMLLAVPIAAVIKLLLTRILERQKERRAI